MENEDRQVRTMGGQRSTQEESIRVLSEKIGPIADSYGIRTVYLYGSRANGDCREDSDYDLLVELPEGFSYRMLFAFQDEVADRLGRDVDVLTMGSLTDDDFSRRVLSQKVLVYAC